jgi:hypothetical protein
MISTIERKFQPLKFFCILKGCSSRWLLPVKPIPCDSKILAAAKDKVLKLKRRGGGSNPWLAEMLENDSD